MPSIKKSNFFLLYYLLYIFVFVIIRNKLIGIGLASLNNIVIIQLISVALPVSIYPIIMKINYRNFCFKKINIKTVLAVVAIAFLTIPVSSSIAIITQNLLPTSYDMDRLDNIITSMNIFQTVIVIVLIPAVFEEIAIRGIVMSGYMKNKLLPSVVFSGILFGLFHLNLYQFFYTSCVGMIIAIILRFGGSIFYCMIFHGIYNSVPIISKYIVGKAYESDTPSQISTSIILSLVMIGIVSCVGIYFLLKYIKNKNIWKYDNFIEESQNRLKISDNNISFDSNIKNKSKDRIVDLIYIACVIVYIFKMLDLLKI